MRKSRGHMVGILCRSEILHVAFVATDRSTGETAAGMAIRAGQPGMSADQSEVGKPRVIEARALPVVYSMARFALERQVRGHMVQRLRLLIVVQVTAGAISAETDVDTRRRPTMARVAGDGGVRAKQREPVQVALHIVHRDAPAAYRVAVLAGSTKLPAVDVGVTIRAKLPDLRENLADMALIACNAFVQTAQGKLCLGVVIKFWLDPDRPPTGGGVAVFTSDDERAVRVAAALRLRLLRMACLRRDEARAAQRQGNQPCPAIRQLPLPEIESLGSSDEAVPVRFDGSTHSWVEGGLPSQEI
jgi:hypothetical protein